jgi:hypothetical protein
MKQKEGHKILEQLQQMMATPQAREMVFKMIAQQVAQAPPERQEALSRVTVTLEKTDRGMSLEVGQSDDQQIEETINQALESWTDMLAHGFQSMGFSVEILE